MTERAPLEPSVAPYIVRNEFFGCLVYERATGRYFALDHDVLHILRSSQTKSLDAVFEEVFGQRAAQGASDKDYRADFEQLIRIFESNNMMVGGRFVGTFLENKVVTQHALSAPTDVGIQLTSHCPNFCNYCWIKRLSNPGSGGDMRTNELKDILKSLAEAGSFRVRFCGGNAISRSDFADLVKYAQGLGLYVSLSVEGSMLDKKRAEMLADLKLPEISIGLASGTDKIWESMRGKEGKSTQRSFVGKASEFLRLLKQRGLATRVSFHAVVINENYDDISHMLARLNNLVREAGGKNVPLRLDPALPIGVPEGNRSIFLDTKHVFDLVDWIDDYNLRKTAGDQVRVTTSAKVPAATVTHPSEGFACSCGVSSAFISAQGYMYPSASVMGVVNTSEAISVRRRNFAAVWQQAPLFNSFRGLTVNDTCKRCPEYKTCHGGCRSRALLFNPKSGRALDPWCRLQGEKDNNNHSNRRRKKQ